MEFESFGPSDLAKLVCGAIVHLFSFVECAQDNFS